MKKNGLSKFLEVTLILVLCVFIVTPNHVYATLGNKLIDRKTQKMLEEDDRLADLYIKEDIEGLPYFDTDLAKKNGENVEAIEIGMLFNDYSNAMNHPENIQTELKMRMPIWGNWCGPGYGGGVPIDILDEGCKIHDGCYNPGKNNCKCNQILINYINKNIHRMTGGQKKAAKAVRLYFKWANRNC